MSSSAIAMNAEDQAQIREVVRCAGSPNQAAEALGVNVATLARALAGLPVQPISASYLRLTLPRVLQRLQRGKPVARTG